MAKKYDKFICNASSCKLRKKEVKYSVRDSVKAVVTKTCDQLMLTYVEWPKLSAPNSVQI